MFVVLSEGPGRGFRLAEPASLPRTKPNGNPSPRIRMGLPLKTLEGLAGHADHRQT